MTSLQEKEFELLKLFIGICKKHKLTYYLVCGSALGAVKYKGFIPWDDDVDVALLRDDYEKFLKVAQAELPEGIFLQNYKTDTFYPGIGSKLRNSKTTFIEKEASQIPMNHGVFIDIFPLDGYPSNTKEKRDYERKRWNAYRRRYVRLIPVLHKDIGLTITSLFFRLFGWFSDTSKACEEADELAKRYPPAKSDLWCNFANSMRDSEFAPREYYGKGVIVQFEGLQVRVPEKYHDYLTQKYGDYTKDLPKEKQVPSHGYIVDINKAYTEYLKEI